MRNNTDDFGWDLNDLRRAQSDGRLVFVLGAGVSQQYGLPDWFELLQKLLISSGRLPRLRDRRGRESRALREDEITAIRRSLETLAADPLLQAAVVRNAYPPKKMWMQELQNHLKPPADSKSAADERLPLRTIARMLVDTGCAGKYVPVLTFNFDALLEEAIHAEVDARRAAGRKALPRVVTVSTSQQYAAARRRTNKRGIFIFHLHGFIGGEASDEPVLDVQSYVHVLRGRHWSRECLRASLIDANATALFLGLSFADPNLRFVLSDWVALNKRLSGYYIAAPPPVPEARTLSAFRQLAFLSRTILDLYDEALQQLQLVPYHLSSWDELHEILKNIAEEEGS